MTKQPQNVDGKSANLRGAKGIPYSAVRGFDTRRVLRPSTVSLRYLSPRCLSLPFRRRKDRLSQTQRRTVALIICAGNSWEAWVSRRVLLN